MSHCSADLDLDNEAADKLPDLFKVTMDIKVSNDERPVREQLSWSNWNPSCTNPLTPFSGREEYDQMLQLFGMSNYYYICLFTLTLVYLCCCGAPTGLLAVGNLETCMSSLQAPLEIVRVRV